MSMAGLKYYLGKRGSWFFILSRRGLLNWMDDETYLKLLFRYSMGYPLDLEHPKTYNEKLQWLKLHDRKPLYTQLVDKLEVKKYVADKIGPEYVVPVIAGPWDSVDEIDFDALPDQFVLKCTHDSGGVVICRDKSSFDIEAAKAKLAKALRRNFYWANREWPYKDVKPRVFAEQYMGDDSGADSAPNEFQFWCFHGAPRFISAILEPHGRNLKCTYDPNWKRLPYVTSPPVYEKEFSAPPELERMSSFAAMLCPGVPFVRVDFMIFNGRVYVGELTIFPAGGFVQWDPHEADRHVGDMLDLDLIQTQAGDCP